MSTQHNRVGDLVPRRGGRLTRRLGVLIFRLTGWRTAGGVPNLPKFVMIAAPHTSNWDFLHGICAMLVLDLRISWIGKHSMFRWPLGRPMRWLGGTPVRRDKTVGRVDQIIAAMNAAEQYVVTIAPEGTRKRTDRWRTGFYHVAHGAGVPIVPAYLDYGQRIVGFGPAFDTTGDLERDLVAIRAFYDDKRPKKPAQF
jgi:1-acyl-sn-glycerol-3-phosphate acyltransferase